MGTTSGAQAMSSARRWQGVARRAARRAAAAMRAGSPPRSPILRSACGVTKTCTLLAISFTTDLPLLARGWSLWYTCTCLGRPNLPEPRLRQLCLRGGISLVLMIPYCSTFVNNTLFINTLNSKETKKRPTIIGLKLDFRSGGQLLCCENSHPDYRPSLFLQKVVAGGTIGDILFIQR